MWTWQVGDVAIGRRPPYIARAVGPRRDEQPALTPAARPECGLRCCTQRVATFRLAAFTDLTPLIPFSKFQCLVLSAWDEMVP